jgi:hypothetical protein
MRCFFPPSLLRVRLCAFVAALTCADRCNNMCTGRGKWLADGRRFRLVFTPLSLVCCPIVPLLLPIVVPTYGCAVCVRLCTVSTVCVPLHVMCLYASLSWHTWLCAWLMAHTHIPCVCCSAQTQHSVPRCTAGVLAAHRPAAGPRLLPARCQHPPRWRQAGQPVLSCVV